MNRYVLPGLLFLMVSILPSSLADTITTREGISHTGTITGITEDKVTLAQGRGTAILMRDAIVEVTFDVSDAIVLTSPDTLYGRVLRRDNDVVIVALEEGLRAVPGVSIGDILYSAGGQVRVKELSHTGDAFRVGKAAPKTIRTPLFFSMCLGPQSVTYTALGLKKPFSGTMHRLELGLEISPSFTATCGIIIFDALPRKDVYQQMTEAGYLCYYVSGAFNFSPQRAFDVFLRLQAGVHRGSWKIGGNANFTAASPTPSIVPGVGVRYKPFSFFQVYGECDLHLASLPMSNTGDAMDTSGPVFLAGFRVYVPGLGI
jgi:hypothetical protein